MSHSKPLITAEEFEQRADPGPFDELVRGKLVTHKLPDPRHGEVCCKTMGLLEEPLKVHDQGRLIPLSRVVTQTDPDTVRAADLAFHGSDEEMPEWIIEVRDSGENWPDLLARVVEYHKAGVGTIYILDNDSKTAHVYGPDRLPRVFKGDEEVAFAGFSVRVGEFFA